MAKIKCPDCDTEIDIPDDPRLGEMLEAMQKQQNTIDKFAEMLADLGKKVAVPVPNVPGAVQGKKKGTRVILEGLFFDEVEEYEEEEGEPK